MIRTRTKSWRAANFVTCCNEFLLPHHDEEVPPARTTSSKREKALATGCPARWPHGGRARPEGWDRYYGDRTYSNVASTRNAQRELKHGAARFVRICPQPTPVSVDDRPTNRQSHPRSAGLRGVECLEN